MRRIVLAIIVLVCAALAALALGNHLGTLTALDWLNFNAAGIDTLKGFKVRPDSVHVTVLVGNTSDGQIYFATTGANPVAASWVDSTALAGDAKIWVNLLVGDIDGDSTGLYTVIVDKFYNTKSWQQEWTFYKADSNFNRAVSKAARDSAVTDLSLLLTGLILTSSNFAANALDWGVDIDTAGFGAAVSEAVWNYATRVLTSGSFNQSLFLTKIVVDAQGEYPKKIIVVDTTSLGGSIASQYLERRLQSPRNANKSLVIERASVTGDMCSLQVVDSFHYAPQAGDTLLLWHAIDYIMTTLAVTAQTMADSLLLRNLTGAAIDSTVRGFLKLAASGVIDIADLDSAWFYTILNTRGHDAALDSLVKRMNLLQAYGLPVRGELTDTNTAIPADVRKIGASAPAADSLKLIALGQSPLRLVDSLMQAFSATANIPDSVVDFIEEILDSVQRDWSSIGCVGLGASALTWKLYVIDTLGTDHVVPQAWVGLFPDSTCSYGTEIYWGWSGTVSGFVPFAPDTGVYWVNANAAGQWNCPAPMQVHITDSGTDSIFGYGYASSTRAIAEGYVYRLEDVDGVIDTLCRWCAVTFEMAAAGPVRDTVRNLLVANVPIETYTNGSGYVRTELWKTQNLMYTSGGTKSPVSWRMTIKTPSGYITEKSGLRIPNDSTTIDIGEW